MDRYQDPVYQNSERLYVRFCSASFKHLQWIQNKIKFLLKIKGFITTHRTRIFYLRFAKNDSLILLPYLYHSENIPYLQRKYKIVKDLLNN